MLLFRHSGIQFNRTKCFMYISPSNSLATCYLIINVSLAQGNLPDN